MGKATRVKRDNARERIAAQRAAQRKREMRNRMLWTGGSILGVIVIVVAFVLVKTTQSPTKTAGANSADGHRPAGQRGQGHHHRAVLHAGVGGYRHRRPQERDHGRPRLSR